MTRAARMLCCVPKILLPIGAVFFLKRIQAISERTQHICFCLATWGCDLRQTTTTKAWQSAIMLKPMFIAVVAWANAAESRRLQESCHTLNTKNEQSEYSSRIHTDKAMEAMPNKEQRTACMRVYVTHACSIAPHAHRHQ